ncbi:MAG: ECF-type sigma factor [Pseudomonadota bacterium]
MNQQRWLLYTVNMVEPQDQTRQAESPGEVTRLIRRWQSGSDAALEDLLPLVYAELRQIAGTYLAREDVEVSLQPTELVSEAFLRLVRQGTAHADCRQHFFAAAAQVIRRLLVEAARRRRAARRFSSLTVTLDGEMPAPAASADLLDIEAALEDLTKINARQARVVELRFFGGLTIPEVASISEVSVATTERDWSAARRWLRRRLASIRPMSEPT